MDLKSREIFSILTSSIRLLVCALVFLHVKSTISISQCHMGFSFPTIYNICNLWTSYLSFFGKQKKRFVFMKIVWLFLTLVLNWLWCDITTKQVYQRDQIFNSIFNSVDSWERRDESEGLLLTCPAQRGLRARHDPRLQRRRQVRILQQLIHQFCNYSVFHRSKSVKQPVGIQ